MTPFSSITSSGTTAIAARRSGEDLLCRPDKAANILAPVEAQCQWLREIGYTTSTAI